jgi:hypothetical protein
MQALPWVLIDINTADKKELGECLEGLLGGRLGCRFERLTGGKGQEMLNQA